MLQLGQHYSALDAGIAITPFAADAALSGAIAGSQAARHGRDLVAAGLALMLTLAAVPVPQAGAAGGLYQTGQRIGASIGIATAGSAFFATLRGGGSFAGAYCSGIIVMSAIVAAALLLALIDRHRAAATKCLTARPTGRIHDLRVRRARGPGSRG